MIKTNRIPYFIDYVFCLLILPSLIMLLPIEKWLSTHSVFIYIMVCWLYMVYFMNRRLLMPLMFSGNKKRIYISVSIFIVILLITFLLSAYKNIPSDHVLHKFHKMRYIHRFRLQQQALWFLFVLVMSFSTAVGLLTELYNQSKKVQKIEFERKKAELSVYKAQINPHFLFNSLNTLYGMIITKSDKTEKAFMQFVELMKYMYSNSDKDKIPVTTEIDYISKYIELQKYRLKENIRIDFRLDVDEMTKNRLIAPMILITFVENIFKHGISSHNGSQISIDISAKNNELRLETVNPIVRNDGNKYKGIGIENCKKRLDLLYNGNYDIDIKSDNDIYKLVFNLKLV